MQVTSMQGGALCLDIEAMWAQLATYPTTERLGRLLEMCDVPFHDDERRYAQRPSILLSSIGNNLLRIREGDIRVGAGGASLSEVLAEMRQAMGYSGMMSYLNPKSRSADEMFDLTVRVHGVPSAAHVVHLGVLIAGLSTAAELEFNCQRDLVHLSRITNARTIAQDDPPFLVRNAGSIPLNQRLRALVQEEWPITPGMTAAEREQRNALWPTSKCSCLGISGSLKNLLKLAEMRNDTGKEDEVREICTDLHAILVSLFPHLANPNRSDANAL